MLGPLLFGVSISDIPSAIESATFISYSADTKVSRVVKTLTDILRLQHDLRTIYKWADENYMQFNGQKFQALLYQTNYS